jgi:cytochrome c-type biogenesis protein CcmH/NrfF
MCYVLRDHTKVQMKRFLPILLFTLILALLAAGLASAQEPTPRPVSDDQVNVVAKQLYCPVCENIPLDVCGTQACEQWRGLIREKLAAGWSEGQVKQYFVDQYGDRVLGTPPARSLNWLVSSSHRWRSWPVFSSCTGPSAPGSNLSLCPQKILRKLRVLRKMTRIWLAWKKSCASVNFISDFHNGIANGIDSNS